MLPYIICAMILGLLTEAAAYALSLWWYRITWVRLINIGLVFGGVFGAASWLLADKGLLVQMAVGAALGLIIEIVNDRILKFWHFPGDPWTFLKGQPAVIGVGLSWALVPPLVVFFISTR